jgi:hypothetical protein
MRFTKEFAQAAGLHLKDPRAFFEYVFPNIVDMVRRMTNVSI